MLDYIARYPGQVSTTDPNYPQGKARNRTTPGDGSGTPFEADMLNDIWGFLQSLIQQSGITPSGSPDHANVSQLAEAIRQLTRRHGASWVLDNVSAAAGANYVMTEQTVTEGAAFGTEYSLATGDTEIVVNDPGWYLLALQANGLSFSAANPLTCSLRAGNGSGFGEKVEPFSTRYSADTDLLFSFAGSTLLDLTSIASITVKNTSTVAMTVEGIVSLTKINGGADGW